MSQESNHTPANNPDSQKPIFDELDMIYQNQPDSLVNHQFQMERVTNPQIRRLYHIADSITEARARELDTHFLTHAEHQKKFADSVAKVLFRKSLVGNRAEPLTVTTLITRESEIGATIFGSMKPNEQRREFFYDGRIGDRDSWFFHQEVAESTGPAEVTLHYEVHPTNVLRISSHPETKNEFIQGKEFTDFQSAVEIYHDLVMDKLYSEGQSPSKKAA